MYITLYTAHDYCQYLVLADHTGNTYGDVLASSFSICSSGANNQGIGAGG